MLAVENSHRIQQEFAPVRTTTSYRCFARLGMIGLVSGLAGQAGALGLGAPDSVPRIGYPLRVEIPLVLAPGERLPRDECVRLQTSAQAVDSQFFPRNARMAIQSGNRPLVRIVSSEAVTEPLLEFRLVVGCDTVVARDFLLLSEVSPAPATGRNAPKGRTDISVEAAIDKGKQTGSPIRWATSTAVLLSDTSLNALARERFPASRELRDDYRRRAADSNPQLFAGIKHVGAVPLPAGITLQLPVNLPAAGATSHSSARASLVPPGGLVKVAAIINPLAGPQGLPRETVRADKLVVRATDATTVRRAPPLTPSELSAAIERIGRMIEDQGRTELQIVGGLDTVNQAFVEMKDFVSLIDTEQRSLKRAKSHCKRGWTPCRNRNHSAWLIWCWRFSALVVWAQA